MIYNNDKPLSLSLLAQQRQTLLLVVVALLLSGCGATSGGATYRITYSSPDGATLEARADVVNESESVVAKLVRDDAGVKEIHFEKRGTRQAEQSMLNLLETQTQLLQQLLLRAP